MGWCLALILFVWWYETEFEKLKKEINKIKNSLAMDNKKIAETMWNATIRIEQVIHLAGALADTELLGDPLNDMLDLADDKTMKELFGKSEKNLPQYLLDNLEDSDMVADYLITRAKGAPRLGFMVNVETPIMKPHIDSIKSGGTYSWGTRRTAWFYGETLQEAYNKCFKWAEEIRRDEKEKLLKECTDEMAVNKARTELEEYYNSDDYKTLMTELQV